MSPPLLGGWRGVAALILYPLLMTTALAQTPPSAEQPPPAAQQSSPAVGPSLVEGTTLPEVEIIATRLNEARINIEPRIGASTYTLTKDAVQDLPGGTNAPIDDALLQMPGVNQDNLANNGIHIRNEHLNVRVIA